MLTGADAETGYLRAEMEALADYICDGKIVDVAALLNLYGRQSSRIIQRSRDAARQALRREMLRSAIRLFQFEAQFLLRDHSLAIQLERAQSQDRGGKLPNLSRAPGPDLIERLLLVMVFREGYSYSHCAALLACPSVALLQTILDRALGRLR